MELPKKMNPLRFCLAQANAQKVSNALDMVEKGIDERAVCAYLQGAVSKCRAATFNKKANEGRGWEVRI